MVAAGLTVRERFERLVRDSLPLEGREIKDTDRFVEELNADSFDALDIMIASEAEFGIDLTDHDTLVLTFGEAVRELEAKLCGPRS